MIDLALEVFALYKRLTNGQPSVVAHKSLPVISIKDVRIKLPYGICANNTPKNTAFMCAQLSCQKSWFGVNTQTI